MSFTSQRAAAGTQMLRVEVMYYVLRCLARAGSKLAVLNNLISLLTAMCPQSWRKMCALLSDTQLCLCGFFAHPAWAVLAECMGWLLLGFCGELLEVAEVCLSEVCALRAPVCNSLDSTG